VLLTLAEALQREDTTPLPHGTHIIDYFDATHSTQNEWTDLLEVNTSSATRAAVASEAHTHYSVQLVNELLAEGKPDLRQIRDILAQVFVRLGLLEPVVGASGLNDLLELKRHQAVVLVPDTNALATGTMHWIVRALAPVQVWMLPAAISLTTAQRQDESLKSQLRDPKSTHLRRALRSRSLINSMLGFLRRHEDRYQVIEVDPQLLRYFAPRRSGVDPDEGEVLEDRLFIEAIHSYFATTRSRGERRVVTADVFLTRVLEAEGIPVLAVSIPDCPRSAIPCLRYDALAGGFVGSPLIALLWDLSHTFASVRLRDRDGTVHLQLRAHWPNKSADDWRAERLQVERFDAGSETSPGAQAETTAEEVPTPSASGENEVTSTVNDVASPAGIFTTAAVPETSFLQVLKLGGAALMGPRTLDQLLDDLDPRPSGDVARMAAEVLLRASLVEFKDGLIEATPQLSELDTALLAQSLDHASVLFRAYLPYRLALDTLKAESEVSVDQLITILASRIGVRPSKDAVERLLRIPVYLGQAWTDGGMIRDGTARPADDDLVAATISTFDEAATDGLCAVSELLPRLCRKLHISAWAAGKALGAAAERGLLSALSFQPSAGHRVAARDQILIGGLREVRVVLVPLDRIAVGGRPVFTVTRSASD
jgi:hypothetical protein